MSDPTALPFQEDDRSTSPEDSIYEGQRPARADDPESRQAVPPPAGVEASQTDLLPARVTGPEDHVGMTALWRLTMDLGHWWFIAVGEEGQESPAAAQIDGQMMLLTFTNAERARHFAVQNGMIGADDDLRAIALPPQEVVQSDDAYRQAGIAGLMFDPHITGYFMPSDQLSVVWNASWSGR